MNIFKNIANLIMIIFVLVSFYGCGSKVVSEEPVSSLNLISGTISVSKNWLKDGGPYLINDDTLIETNAVLTIGPGTEINFLNNSKLQVKGKLLILGTESEKVIISQADIICNTVNEKSYDSSGNYAAGSRFENCNISDGKIQSSGSGIYIKKSTINKLDSTINSINGLYIESSTIVELGETNLNLNESFIYNSYIGTLRLEAGTGKIEINRCELSNLIINGNTNENKIERNNIKYIDWSNTGNSTDIFIHDNNIIGTGNTFVFRVSNFNQDAIRLDASSNYWGETVTGEMDFFGDNTDISVIYDYFDDNSLIRIDYSGRLAVSVEGSGPDW